MDYRRIYRQFIEDRKARPEPEGYTERHHIVPRSLGGSDDAENLIRLTAEDHYFAHCCLAKIHGAGMWTALCRMRWGRVHGERLWVRGRPFYALARKRFAEFNSKRCKGQAGIRGAANGRYDGAVLRWTSLDTGEVITATKWEMWDRFGGNRATWTMVANGSRRTMQGWTCRPEETRIRGHKGKTFTFVNRDGRKFTGRQSEFAQAFGINAASASRVTRHGDVTRCGWRLLGVPDRPSYGPRGGGHAWQHRKSVSQTAS